MSIGFKRSAHHGGRQQAIDSSGLNGPGNLDKVYLKRKGKTSDGKDRWVPITAAELVSDLPLGDIATPAPGSPASNASGVPGEEKYDAFYIYKCLVSGTWVRIPYEGGY